MAFNQIRLQTQVALLLPLKSRGDVPLAVAVPGLGHLVRVIFFSGEGGLAHHLSIFSCKKAICVNIIHPMLGFCSPKIKKERGYKSLCQYKTVRRCTTSDGS